MGSEDQKHDARVGQTFTAVCHTGRVIPLGKVIRHEGWRGLYPFEVAWYDENGKHYEWFNLADTAQEFREFTWVTQEEA